MTLLMVLASCLGNVHSFALIHDAQNLLDLLFQNIYLSYLFSSFKFYFLNPFARVVSQPDEM